MSSVVTHICGFGGSDTLDEGMRMETVPYAASFSGVRTLDWVLGGCAQLGRSNYKYLYHLLCPLRNPNLIGAPALHLAVNRCNYLPRAG